jgi:hypothetical protein
MSRSSGKDHRCMRARTLPLILPMPRAFYWDVDTASPWLSIDPAFGAQCAAFYRSVRLTVLALIAFLGGSRSLRAGNRAERSQEMGSLQAIPPQRASVSPISRQAASPIPPVFIARRPLRNRRGASALAVDTPKRDRLQFEVMRTHAPPAAHLQSAFNTVRFDRFTKFCNATLPHQAGLSRVSRQAAGQISPIFGSRSPFTIESGASALAVDTPKRNTPQFEIKRAHAPPAERRKAASSPVRFDRLIPICNAVVDFSSSAPQKTEANTKIDPDRELIRQNLACRNVPPIVQPSREIRVQLNAAPPNSFPVAVLNTHVRRSSLCLSLNKSIPVKGDNHHVRF